MAHIAMVGGGALIRPLAVLSTRAGHSILRIDDAGSDTASCSHSDMIIVAGDRTALVDLIRRVASVASPDAVVIDATTSVKDEQADGAEEVDPGGPLWDKALDLAELVECVGWLSGDG